MAAGYSPSLCLALRIADTTLGAIVSCPIWWLALTDWMGKVQCL